MAKALKAVKVSMSQATPHLTVNVRLVGVNTWKARFWLFRMFLKLAALCYPGSLCVNWSWSPILKEDEDELFEEGERSAAWTCDPAGSDGVGSDDRSGSTDQLPEGDKVCERRSGTDQLPDEAQPHQSVRDGGDEVSHSLPNLCVETVDQTPDSQCQ